MWRVFVYFFPFITSHATVLGSAEHNLASSSVSICDSLPVTLPPGGVSPLGVFLVKFLIQLPFLLSFFFSFFIYGVRPECMQPLELLLKGQKNWKHLNSERISLNRRKFCHLLWLCLSRITLMRSNHITEVISNSARTNLAVASHTLPPRPQILLFFLLH